MKNRIYTRRDGACLVSTTGFFRRFVIFALPLMLVGCSKFTDIIPKGENRLNTVEELEMLLNNSNFLNVNPIRQRYLVNDIVPDGGSNLMNILMDDFASGNPSHEGVLVLWDMSETFDRSKILISGGDSYEAFYRIINRICNPIIDRIDHATGNRLRAHQVKSEALVLRAYFHWLSVNFYAKAYNPATAATDGGVPFIDENYDMGKPAEKKSVLQVYELILRDLDSVNYNALPEAPLDMRVGRAFAYAVRAKVWMSMHKYPEAKIAAEASLAINSRVLDHSNDVRPNNSLIPYFSRDMYNVEELFGGSYNGRQGWALSGDLIASFEEFDMFKNHGDLETNMLPPMDGNVMNSAPNGTNIVGTVALFSDFRAGIGRPLSYSVTGLTTVDMHLTLAECLLREGKAGEAGVILDRLRERRTKPGHFVPLGAATLANLKRVSRNENFFTVHNFINLKRWNTDPLWQETLSKTLQISPAGFISTGENSSGNGNQWVPNPVIPVITRTFTLRPDSPLWVFAFPQSASDFNPNLTPNY